MQHSTSFRHMFSLRYIICCSTLLMLYSGTPNLVLNGERKKGFCAFNLKSFVQKPFYLSLFYSQIRVPEQELSKQVALADCASQFASKG